MNKKTVVAVAVIVTIAVVVALVAITNALRGSELTLIQGEVDATEYKISSKLAGRIDTIRVHQGQEVKKGELLYVMATPEVGAKLEQAQAARTAAAAQKSKVDAGARKQIIASAKAVVEEVQLMVEYAQKSYDRVEALYQDGVVSLQKRDEVKVNLDVAKQKLQMATQQYQMAKEGAQWEDKVAAGALVDRAQGAVNEVESYLADASQLSPIDGEISSVIAQVGELVSTGYPVMTVVDMRSAWVSFNVTENLLPQLPKGKKLDVYVPGLDKNIELEIVSISVEADYATWSSTRSKGGFDIRTFELRAVPTTKDTGLRVGMTVVYELPSTK